MSQLNVRIVKLEPMRVASFHAFGSEPENAALQKLVAWAAPQGLLDKLEEHRIFGFNNPNPSPGSPNYGYEFWMVVEADAQAEGEVEIKEFAGGLYAVCRCEVQGRPYETIPAAWRELVLWREDSPYTSAGEFCLEEQIRADFSADAEWDLDLYLPIGLY
jgi:DNA gyrase inhibitor GyrI